MHNLDIEIFRLQSLLNRELISEDQGPDHSKVKLNIISLATNSTNEILPNCIKPYYIQLDFLLVNQARDTNTFPRVLKTAVYKNNRNRLNLLTFPALP